MLHIDLPLVVSSSPQTPLVSLRDGEGAHPTTPTFAEVWVADAEIAPDIVAPDADREPDVTLDVADIKPDVKPIVGDDRKLLGDPLQISAKQLGQQDDVVAISVPPSGEMMAAPVADIRDVPKRELPATPNPPSQNKGDAQEEIRSFARPEAAKAVKSVESSGPEPDSAPRLIVEQTVTTARPTDGPSEVPQSALISRQTIDARAVDAPATGAVSKDIQPTVIGARKLEGGNLADSQTTAPVQPRDTDRLRPIAEHINRILESTKAVPSQLQPQTQPMPQLTVAPTAQRTSDHREATLNAPKPEVLEPRASPQNNAASTMPKEARTERGQTPLIDASRTQVLPATGLTPAPLFSLDPLSESPTLLRPDADISGPLRIAPYAGSGPLHPQQTHALQVAQQIAAATLQSKSGITEIVLNPEELGRVRMALSTGEGGVSVSILAERPETTDLIRRNIEILAREFREMGYDSVSFSFEEQAENPDAQPDAGPQSETSDRIATDDDTPETPLIAVALRSGLDLKL